MNYFEHNDSKGRDARRAVELNKAERAKARDFDGTLFMSKWEMRAARAQGDWQAYWGRHVERCGVAS